MIEKRTEYHPDFVTSPGETLLETLDELGMTQAELAVRMGRPKKTINEIVKGKTAITPETALQLELALKIPASFWNKRERRYQEAKALAEQEVHLAQWTDWLNKVPYRELVHFGWIEDRDETVDRLREALAFFGVVSPRQWEILWKAKMDVTFRKSQAYSTNEVAVAAWLRKAELEAHDIKCAPFDEALLRQVLDDIRGLTRETPSPQLYQEKLPEIFRSVGVAFTIVRRLSGTRVFGASQWLSPQKAHIAVSLYYKSDDHFWFTVFHEAAHILLHSKKEVFIDEEDDGVTKSQEESEANKFASDLLISASKLHRFIQSRPWTASGERFFDPDEIRAFAEEIGVAPSIVVGRLQHYDKVLKPSFRNELKTWLDWSDEGRLVIKSYAQL